MAINKTVKVVTTQVNGFTIEAEARKFKLFIDQPENGGGADAGPTPLEYLFFSLGGCIVTIGHIVAKQKRLPVRSIRAEVEGDINTDILMGKSKEDRSGFQDIRVHVYVDADMTREEKEKFLEEVDARCPISDNIQNLSNVKLIVED